MKFSVRQGTTRDQLKGRTSSRDLSIMSYKILVVVLKSTRKRGGCDGKKEKALMSELEKGTCLIFNILISDKNVSW